MIVKNKKRKNVLIAGIAGASLGTEIFKSLRITNHYNIFGVDISPYAYGLYEEGFTKTYVINGEEYIKNIFRICKKEKIDAIIPGGGEPLSLLSKNKDLFEGAGILLAINSTEIIELSEDKIKMFNYLNKQGIPVPNTKIVDNPRVLKNFSYPCIIKPSTDSGGSVFVYLAENKEEAIALISYLKKRNKKVIIQEYIPVQEGEYSLSVLSFPNGEIVGSIALKRFFNSKLSYLIKYGDRVVSSPYSQGLVDNFQDIRSQAEKIALKIKSCGPLNIQGRVKNGIFYPFELNARFSGGTYLRAIAGFNEVDIFLQFLLNRKKPSLKQIKYGYYLRTLDEEFVSFKQIKKYD